VAEQQGSDLQSIAALVKENEEILDQMKHILRESFVAELIRLILRSDHHDNMKIDLDEAPRLVLRLNIQMEPYGIELDTDLFVQMLEQDNSFENILRFCKDILYPEIALKRQAEEEAAKAAAAALAEDKGDDSAIINRQSVDTTAREKFRSFIQQMSELSDDKQDAMVENMYRIEDKLEDKLAMFTISEKYTRGSVGVARGKGNCLLPSILVTTKRQDRVSKVMNEAFKACNECHNKAAEERRKTVGRASF